MALTRPSRTCATRRSSSGTSDRCQSRRTGSAPAIGFLAGARLPLVATRRLGISDPVVYAALTRGAIGAVLGARVAYVINHLGSFDSPLECFQVWNGGTSLLGGIAGGLALGLPPASPSGS